MEKKQLGSGSFSLGSERGSERVSLQDFHEAHGALYARSKLSRPRARERWDFLLQHLPLVRSNGEGLRGIRGSITTDCTRVKARGTRVGIMLCLSPKQKKKNFFWENKKKFPTIFFFKLASLFFFENLQFRWRRSGSIGSCKAPLRFCGMCESQSLSLLLSPSLAPSLILRCTRARGWGWRVGDCGGEGLVFLRFDRQAKEA